MTSIEKFLDQRLASGRETFTRTEVASELTLTTSGLESALARLRARQRIASPYKNFYVIVRPEDVVMGAPDVDRWIDPLMRHLDLDYRVSLLRAAALHGSSHQAVMIFQVIVPKQLRSFEIGRQRIQFLTQAAREFNAVNQEEFLTRIKSRSGYAKAAGLELNLLDAARYCGKAGGINGVAQMAKTLGGRASSRRLSALAAHYETPCVRRLGFLLEYFNHNRQARALEPFVASAKTRAPLDPSAIVIHSLGEEYETDAKWKIVLNREVEVDD
ncbi:type IV toxin-antitoxin system AbiEi family antitoxin domain-containing protein [Roseateles sp. L2-2]|uniref:type IV toxin-antitoxin system AbiEi family antitoxin domain-containing protein n=1 Tax=Roseateles sp. L2-2 TaxID=3422597 RepID=UPI003D367A5A